MKDTSPLFYTDVIFHLYASFELSFRFFFREIQVIIQFIDWLQQPDTRIFIWKSRSHQQWLPLKQWHCFLISVLRHNAFWIRSESSAETIAEIKILEHV